MNVFPIESSETVRMPAKVLGNGAASYSDKRQSIGLHLRFAEMSDSFIAAKEAGLLGQLGDEIRSKRVTSAVP